MNLILAIFLSIASVYGSFWIMKTILGKAMSMSLRGYSSSKLIGEGSPREKIKAKILNKAPLSNPDVVGNQQTGLMNLNNRIPDMRGVNSGTAGVPAVQSTSLANTVSAPSVGGSVPSVGGGIGAVAMVGLANAVGVVMQNGTNLNNLRSRRSIVGAVFQGGGMIYNVKSKGARRLTQNANNILNTTNRGRVKMTQGQGVRNAISQGRISIKPTGAASNYIYGEVKGIKSRIGNIRTKDLRIQGASKPKSLFVKNLYAPKAKRLKIQELNNNGFIGKGKFNMVSGGLPEGNGNRKRRLRVPGAAPGIAGENNIRVNLNDINLSKQNGYNLHNQRYSINKSSNDYITMIGMKNIAADARNQGLDTEQRGKLYNLTRVNEERRIASGNSNDTSGYDRTELFRQLVSTVPGMSTKDMRKVASEANRLREQRRLNQQLLANQMADRKMDMNKENMNALNNLLKDTSGSASAHFHNFIEENFKDEIERELSPEEIKAIEEQARENINNRNDISLEQKEEEYEKERTKLLGEKERENSGAIEELLKERIVDNPEDAESVLGGEGAQALKEQLNNIKDERDRAVVKELIRQDLKANANYLKSHPEYNKEKYDEIYKARQHDEMQQDIETAVGQLYSQRKQGDNEQYIKNLNANTPQPQADNSSVFIPRQIQDRFVNGGMG